MNGVIIPVRDDTEYVAKAQVFDIAAGGSKSITLDTRSIYLVMGSSNVHGVCSLVRTANTSILAITPLITESGVSLTYSGATLTINNTTTYSLPYQLLKLSY